MNLRRLYKSNSYKNTAQAYAGNQTRRAGRSVKAGGPNTQLAHLEQVEGPGAVRRGARDYLNEIRDQRVARETKLSNVGKVKQVIKNEKLSNLQKLNMVKTQADKIERDALQRER